MRTFKCDIIPKDELSVDRPKREDTEVGVNVVIKNGLQKETLFLTPDDALALAKKLKKTAKKVIQNG